MINIKSKQWHKILAISLTVICFRCEMLISHRGQLRKYDISYMTTVKELKDIVTRELCIEGEIDIQYESNTLDDDMILMKDEHLRLDPYALLQLSDEGKTEISSFPTTVFSNLYFYIKIPITIDFDKSSH